MLIKILSMVLGVIIGTVIYQGLVKKHAKNRKTNTVKIGNRIMDINDDEVYIYIEPTNGNVIVNDQKIE